MFYLFCILTVGAIIAEFFSSFFRYSTEVEFEVLLNEKNCVAVWIKCYRHIKVDTFFSINGRDLAQTDFIGIVKNNTSQYIATSRKVLYIFKEENESYPSFKHRACSQLNQIQISVRKQYLLYPVFGIGFITTKYIRNNECAIHDPYIPEK